MTNDVSAPNPVSPEVSSPSGFLSTTAGCRKLLNDKFGIDFDTLKLPDNDRKKAKDFLTKCYNALSGSQLLDKDNVKKASKNKSVSTEELEKLMATVSEKTGDELAIALLKALGIDVYDCLSEATQKGLESDLRAAEESATRCKAEQTEGSLKNCMAALNKFSTKVMSLGGDKLRDRFTNRLKVILDKYEGTKMAAGAKEQRTRAVETALNKADKFEALRQLRIDYTDIIDQDSKLRGLVARQLLKIVGNNAAEADQTLIKDFLAADVRLPDNQKLISFEYQGRSYVILAEKDQAGKWQIRSKGLPAGNLVVEQKGGKFTVRESGASGSPLKTNEIAVNPPLNQPITLASAPLVPAGYASRTIDGNRLVMWKEEDKNGKMDLAKGEHKTAQFYFKDSQGWHKIIPPNGLTDQLAHYLDGNGKANGGIYDNVVDDNGFKALGDLISFWVDQKQVYDSADSFFKVFNDQNAIIYDVPKAAINEACSNIQGWFNGIDLRDETSVDKALQAKNSGGKVINDIVLAYIKGHKDKPITAANIADLVLRCYVARETGKYKLLGVDEKVNTMIETPSWQTLTAAKLLAWAKGESANSGENSGDTNTNEVAEADRKMRTNRGNLRELENIWNKLSANAKNNPEFQVMMVEVYLKEKSPESLDKALKIAINMGIMKNEYLGKIFEVYFNQKPVNFDKIKETIMSFDGDDAKKAEAIKLAQHYLKAADYDSLTKMTELLTTPELAEAVLINNCMNTADNAKDPNEKFSALFLAWDFINKKPDLFNKNDCRQKTFKSIIDALKKISNDDSALTKESKDKLTAFKEQLNGPADKVDSLVEVHVKGLKKPPEENKTPAANKKPKKETEITLATAVKNSKIEYQARIDALLAGKKYEFSSAKVPGKYTDDKQWMGDPPPAALAQKAHHGKGKTDKGEKAAVENPKAKEPKDKTPPAANNPKAAAAKTLNRKGRKGEVAVAKKGGPKDGDS
jgi:hypothetical protein